MNQAMLKHMKTDVGGVWLEPPAPADKPETEKQKQPMQEDHEVEDEMVDVVVDEGEGRVPAVPEEEMFQDYLVRPTSIRRPREEDGEGRVPEEDGEGRVPEEDGEGRVAGGGRAHGGSVSLRHCKLRAAVVVGPDSRVRRGECRLSGYNSETGGAPQ